MPATDYFEVFGLPRKLNIDTQDFQQRFYRLSREHHPDRFARGTAEERAAAEEKTADLNDAYRTLRDPALRAEHLLRVEGYRRDGEAKVPASLLEMVFEVNEALEDVQAGLAASRPALEQGRDRLQRTLAENEARLQFLFDDYDVRGADALPDIRTALDRGKYLRNLLTQIENVLN